MMKFSEIKTLEDRFQLATYKKMEMAILNGRGPWVRTSDGEKFLDLYGGHAVCGTGHSHPHVVKAIQSQAGHMLFYSNLVYSEVRAKAAEKLVGVAPHGITKAFFCNSGAEANENAMRMARLVTGRDKVISFAGGFHGRTADSISATYLGIYRQVAQPNVPFHECVEFGSLESVRAAADAETAAIILEPIQSMAGVREAPPEFFRGLRETCDDFGIVLIFDEVQTGVGRTGNWFFAGSGAVDGIEPDIISIAKSLGSGIPVGACLVNEHIVSGIKENDLGSTFGGGMIAMTAVLATLEAIEQDSMLANAVAVEKHLREALLGLPGLVEIRGRGCLIGLEFDEPCGRWHKRLLEKKIITGMSSDPNVLRLLPPLMIRAEEVDMFVGAISE